MYIYAYEMIKTNSHKSLYMYINLMRFSTAPFLVSLLNIKCMLPTIVSNKTLLLCVIRVLKEHTSFLMITLKGSRPLLIKLMDIATPEEMATLYT